MKDGLYTANEVAGIIADLFGDTCACNFNGIDEWLRSSANCWIHARTPMAWLAGNSI